MEPKPSISRGFLPPGNLLNPSLNQMSQTVPLSLMSNTRDRFDTCAELELAEKLGVYLVTLADERYPPLLTRTYDPPPVLYIKGSLTSSDNWELYL
jgi:DNA processing protein